MEHIIPQEICNKLLSWLRANKNCTWTTILTAVTKYKNCWRSQAKGVTYAEHLVIYIIEMMQDKDVTITKP